MLHNVNAVKPRGCQFGTVNRVNGVKLYNVEVKGPSRPFTNPVTAMCRLQTIAMEKSKEQLGHSRGLVTAPTLSPHYGNGEAKGL